MALCYFNWSCSLSYDFTLLLRFNKVLMLNFIKIKMKNILAYISIFILSVTDKLYSQCAMCKAVLESNMQSGEDAVGQGINGGIMYIMFIPYILIAVVGYFLYKHYKKQIAE